MSSPALTAGALAVSLAVTGTNLWYWYKSGKDPKNLLHFGGGYLTGGLATVCTGLLGTLAGWTAGADNGLGKHAVSSTTGHTANTLHHGTAGQLTPGGGIVTVLVAVGFVVAWKAAPKAVKRKLAGGFFSGATLTITIGVAGLFVHVVGLVNGVGDSGYAWFNGGSA